MNRAGIGMANALKGRNLKQTSGVETLLMVNPLTVWNDVGMGDAFQFVRYTLPLLQRGEKVRFAVAASQISLFRDHLAWPLSEVIDRREFSPAEGGAHIPLMSLIALLDTKTIWGRRFNQPTWKIPNETNEIEKQVGFCWASNPKDRTMHVYKSCKPEQLSQIAANDAAGVHSD